MKTKKLNANLSLLTLALLLIHEGYQFCAYITFYYNPILTKATGIRCRVLLYNARDPVRDLRFRHARFKNYRLQKAEYQNGFSTRQRGYAFSIASDSYSILSPAAKQCGQRRIYLCRNRTDYLFRRTVLPYISVVQQLDYHARAALGY